MGPAKDGIPKHWRDAVGGDDLHQIGAFAAGAQRFVPCEGGPAHTEPRK